MSRPSHRADCQTGTAFPGADVDTPEIDPALLLEIRRDGSECDRRWVSTRKALIGSGAACEIRLEAPEISPLHSLICWSEHGFQLEAITPFPPLRVNGEPVEGAFLSDGDRIEIGPFEVVVRQAPAASALGSSRSIHRGNPGSSGQAGSHPACPDIDSEDLTKLSAADLVERIEAEETLVSQFEGRRDAGAAALLQAAAGHAAAQRTDRTEPRPAAVPVEASPATWLDELEGVIGQLTRYATELEQRAESISSKEASFAQAAAAVLDSQQKLVTRLEAILDQLMKLAKSRSGGVRRAA